MSSAERRYAGIGGSPSSTFSSLSRSMSPNRSIRRAQSLLGRDAGCCGGGLRGARQTSAQAPRHGLERHLRGVRTGRPEEPQGQALSVYRVRTPQQRRRQRRTRDARAGMLRWLELRANAETDGEAHGALWDELKSAQEEAGRKHTAGAGATTKPACTPSGHDNGGAGAPSTAPAGAGTPRDGPGTDRPEGGALRGHEKRSS